MSEEMMGCPFCGGHWPDGPCPMCKGEGEIPTPLCWVPYTREEEDLQAELLNGMGSPSTPYIEVARRMLATLRRERDENAAAESRGYVRGLREAAEVCREECAYQDQCWRARAENDAADLCSTCRAAARLDALAGAAEEA